MYFLKILVQTQVAKQALADVESRHKEIIQLENDIITLNQMFVDFGSSVDQSVMFKLFLLK
jgi:t-SNARE complex subunit (syntaxin)